MAFGRGKVAEIEKPLVLSKAIAFLVADWGNRYLKQMLMGNFSSRTLIENSVAFLDKATWEREKKRFKRNPQHFNNTRLFSFKERHPKDEKGNKVDVWSYVAVGDGARHIGRPRNMTEEVKYNYNKYWGAIVCSQLLTMFPAGHEHIVLGLAHPTKSFSVIDDIIAATIGAHHIETIEGKKIVCKVRKIMPWDEPVGAVVFWGHSDEAKSNFFDFKEGNEIMVADIGGGVASMTRIVIQFNDNKQMEFHPVYNQERSPTIGMGVRNVMVRLRNLLSSENAAFKGMKEITDDMLDEGLRTGQVTLSGETVDVTSERLQAEAELLDLLENAYNQNMDSGRPFRIILTTGGGMHSYHKRLADEMFNHKFTRCSSDDIDFVHWTNMRGGDIIMSFWVELFPDFYVKELTNNG